MIIFLVGCFVGVLFAMLCLAVWAVIQEEKENGIPNRKDDENNSCK